MKIDYDTIIIGSGAGGLSAAICLSRAGQKVLVLEQHDVPGGWCHSFYLNGQRFSPGVHYIGLMEKGESTSRLYEGLGIANELVFFRMNAPAYEHCLINGEQFDFPAGARCRGGPRGQPSCGERGGRGRCDSRGYDDLDGGAAEPSETGRTALRRHRRGPAGGLGLGRGCGRGAVDPHLW